MSTYVKPLNAAPTRPLSLCKKKIKALRVVCSSQVNLSIWPVSAFRKEFCSDTQGHYFENMALSEEIHSWEATDSDCFPAISIPEAPGDTAVQTQ